MVDLVHADQLDLRDDPALGAEIELIRMDEINHAYERMEKADVKYRFVIDMSTL